MSEINRSSSRRRTSNTSTSKRSGSGSAGRPPQGSSVRVDRNRSGSSHSSGGRSSGNGHYRRKKKKKMDITAILLYAIGAVVLILVIALAVKGCGKLPGKAVESTEVTDMSSLAESEAGEVTVNGLDISAMTHEEAKAAVMKLYDWSMKVTYQDKEARISNLMEPKINELLEEIYAGDKKGAFQVNADNMLEAARAEAALISGNWNMVGQNGGISGYDKTTGQFTFTQGTNGIVIDQDRLAQDIVTSIEKEDYKAAITAQTKEVAPDMTAEQLKAKYKTIATYSTKTTTNSNRNENIRLSTAALNGTIVNPGQEFSFNNTTGARTEAKGYKPATAYLYGEIVQEPGGGVCQVSSTLYNAVVFAGLTSTERHAHSYEPSYVTPGEDAAVSFGGPDLRFVNSSDYPVAIKASFSNRELVISIYGVPTVGEGEKIRMFSEKVGTLAPPAPTFEEDPYMQLGEEKLVKEGTQGSSWKTYIVKYKDGQEVSREFFHNSSYRGKSGIIKRNTSGTVLTTEAPTEAPTEPAVLETPAVAETGNAQGPAGPGQEPGTTQPPQLSPGGSGPGQEEPAITSPISPGAGQQTTVQQQEPISVPPGTGITGPGAN